MAVRLAMEAPRRVQGIAFFRASLPVDLEMLGEPGGAPPPVFLGNALLSPFHGSRTERA
jgi:hypothetical protein